MRRALATAAVLIPVLAGCGTTAEPTAGVTWQPPASYAYTLGSGCGEQYLIGTVRLWVQGGAVVGAQGLDEPGERLAQGPLDRLPTLSALLQTYQQAVDAGADTAQLTTDPADGHPLTINIDPIAAAMDDESCFLVSDYDPD